jgi:hypothetical protein
MQNSFDFDDPVATFCSLISRHYSRNMRGLSINRAHRPHSLLPIPDEKSEILANSRAVVYNDLR